MKVKEYKGYTNDIEFPELPALVCCQQLQKFLWTRAWCLLSSCWHCIPLHNIVAPKEVLFGGKVLSFYLTRLFVLKHRSTRDDVQEMCHVIKGQIVFDSSNQVELCFTINNLSVAMLCFTIAVVTLFKIPGTALHQSWSLDTPDRYWPSILVFKVAVNHFSYRVRLNARTRKACLSHQSENLQIHSVQLQCLPSRSSAMHEDLYDCIVMQRGCVTEVQVKKGSGSLAVVWQ